MIKNNLTNENTLIAKSLAVVLTISYLYNVTFNFTPEAIRTLLSGGLLIAYFILAATALIQRPAFWQIMVFLSFMLMLFCWAISNSLSFGSFDLRHAAVDIQLFLVVMFLLTFSDVLPLRTFAVWSSVVILLCGALVLFGQPIIYAGDSRPQPLTGGPDRVFPTAYFLLANIVILNVLRQARIVGPSIAWPLLIIGGLALVSYQVRTTLLILTFYVMGVIWRHSPHFRVLGLALFSLSFFGVGVFFGLLDFEGLVGSPIESWGSGRILAYIERTDLLVSRGFGPTFFGTGPGSDVLSNLGWWGFKSSHSDFITVLMERGVIGFVGLIVLIVAIVSRVTSFHGRIVLLAIFAASFIANTFLFGRGVAIFAYSAVALAMIFPIEKPSSSKQYLDSNSRSNTGMKRSYDGMEV